MTDQACPIEWTPDLSVGIEAIDDDHKTFFVVADLMQSAIRENPQNLEAILRSSITILQEYVNGHFLREERAMEAAGYPKLAEHHALHEAFKATAHRFVEDFNKIVDHNEQKKAAQKLAEVVHDWVCDHIAKVDMAYKDFLKAEHVDSRPLAFLSQEADEGGDDDDFDLMSMIPGDGPQ
ncbi:MAG: hemerythrin family protein [Alphaproteobacteria bacterium]|nr:hemerythrin family protein [Alphaproteobacteria bacterium]MBF0356853.1 hemerythrin family protein [Alphaproteobacteria bacterium]